MRLKDGFVINKVGGAYVAVAVGERADEFHALVRLNGTGAFLWELLSRGECSREELTAALLREYDVSPELAAADTARFEEQLRAGGLLDE
ncbi:MAG: PqqD family protein [Clostridia bacterium]|nr:PqqD family protein [Clostridia bacterium]